MRRSCYLDVHNAGRPIREFVQVYELTKAEQEFWLPNRLHFSFCEKNGMYDLQPMTQA